MLPFKRSFETDKQQLQRLNSRLAQYLCRTKQLEHENAQLASEIHTLRQSRTTLGSGESRYRAEMRDLRRQVERLCAEKNQAELERERLRRELHVVHGLCTEQTELCRDIGGELQGCEHELRLAHQANTGLQKRLAQLEGECQNLEGAHQQQVEQLRRQVDARMAVPCTITRTVHLGAPPKGAHLEDEVQEYARGLSQGWLETLEMYQHKVELMEQAIREDQARLAELQREKLAHAHELERMRAEAEKQGHAQVHLEEQLVHMQDRFHGDISEYQMIIQQLEQERNMMANSIEEKMREHQHLLQVKMDLSRELSAYRSLLEGERAGLQDVNRRTNQHQRERIIDIKMPAQPYKPRTSILTTRQHTDTRYTPQASSLSRSPVRPSVSTSLSKCPARPSGSTSPSRVIPISVATRERYQSPASRRDMVSFSKAKAAASTATTTKGPTASEEKTIKINKVPPMEKQTSSNKKSTGAESAPVIVVSPPMMKLGAKMDTESKKQPSEVDSGKDGKDKGRTESEKKKLESVSVEEIIEKVIKPANLEAQLSSSGEPKLKYSVEKMEQEDGTTKTQIVLESKVEEELDVSEDMALDQLLNQGVKKVSLEDIKDTATGSLIKDLLSGLQGAEHLQNTSVNVEIIEEPVDSHSDEDLEDEEKSGSTFHESSKYFQIEELENVPHDAHIQKSMDEALKSSSKDHSYGGSIRVSKQEESSYSSHDQEADEYFVSTPDDNLSDSEDAAITSYGHYGIVDDLSDERYYQDESVPVKRGIVEEGDQYKIGLGDRSFGKETFPECIIEEEVCVSPVVQESVLEFLREDSLEPKEQLKGALEKLQSSVSGPLKDELAFLTKMSRESPEKVSVKKVQQATDNGTMTIVAELNVSQSLEDSGLLDDDDDLSEEKIMAALRSSNPGFEKSLLGGAGGGGYSIKIAKEEGEEFEGGSFQMDTQGGRSEGSSSELQYHTAEKPLKITHEKKVATIVLESHEN